MNRLMKKLEDIMVAITFAESGEYDIAKEMLGETKPTEEEKRTRPEPETA